MIELLVFLGDLHPILLDSKNLLTGGPWSVVALHLGDQMPKLLSQLHNEVRSSHPSTLPVLQELDQPAQIVSQFL